MLNICAGKGKFHAKTFNLSSFNNDIAHCLCGQDATCLVGITNVFLSLQLMNYINIESQSESTLAGSSIYSGRQHLLNKPNGIVRLCVTSIVIVLGVNWPLGWSAILNVHSQRENV